MDRLKGIHKQRLVVILTAIIGIFATTLPWATLGGNFGHLNALDYGPGWVIIFAFAAVIASVLIENVKQAIDFTNIKIKWIFLTSGGGTVLIALISFFRIINEPIISLGFGAFLTLLVGIAIVALPFLDSKALDSK